MVRQCWFCHTNATPSSPNALLYRPAFRSPAAQTCVYFCGERAWPGHPARHRGCQLEGKAFQSKQLIQLTRSYLPPPVESTEASGTGKRKRPADDDADDGFKAPKGPGGEDERTRAMRMMMEDNEPVRWLRQYFDSKILHKPHLAALLFSTCHFPRSLCRDWSARLPPSPAALTLATVSVGPCDHRRADSDCRRRRSNAGAGATGQQKPNDAGHIHDRALAVHGLGARAERCHQGVWHAGDCAVPLPYVRGARYGPPCTQLHPACIHMCTPPVACISQALGWGLWGKVGTRHPVPNAMLCSVATVNATQPVRTLLTHLLRLHPSPDTVATVRCLAAIVTSQAR